MVQSPLPDGAALEALRQTILSAYSAEEAFDFHTLAELAGRSRSVVVGTITALEPGPAEARPLEDGSVLYYETLAISITDDAGTIHTLVQDYGQAIGFDAVASPFPVGARALLFGFDYKLPGARRPDRFDPSTDTMWSLAHPLGFMVLSSDNTLVPLFSGSTTTPKTEATADEQFLRQHGFDGVEVRWPEALGPAAG